MEENNKNETSLDSLSIGDVVELPIVDIADNGDGVGKFDSGLVVLIEGALEGKIVKAKITKKLNRQKEDSGYAKAELLEFTGDYEEDKNDEEKNEEENKNLRRNWYGEN